MMNSGAKWDFSNPTDTVGYWATVKKSYAAPPSQNYLDKASGRGPAMQWHMELEPVYPFQYHDHGTKTMSQNLPTPGRAPTTGSPVMGRIKGFADLGFIINSEEDFGIIENHTFFFVEEKRVFTGNRGSSEKFDAWPTMFNDEIAQNVPDDVYVYPPLEDNGNNGASVPQGDPYEMAAKLLDGKTQGPAYEVASIVPSGNAALTNNVEIMGLVQQGKLTEKLVEKGLVTVAKNGTVSFTGKGGTVTEQEPEQEEANT